MTPKLSTDWVKSGILMAIFHNKRTPFSNDKLNSLIVENPEATKN